MVRRIAIAIGIWAALVIAGFLWGSVMGTFVFHDWTWPWDAVEMDRFLSAMWMGFQAPIIAAMIAWKLPAPTQGDA